MGETFLKDVLRKSVWPANIGTIIVSWQLLFLEIWPTYGLFGFSIRQGSQTKRIRSRSISPSSWWVFKLMMSRIARLVGSLSLGFRLFWHLLFIISPGVPLSTAFMLMSLGAMTILSFIMCAIITTYYGDLTGRKMPTLIRKFILDHLGSYLGCRLQRKYPPWREQLEVFLFLLCISSSLFQFIKRYSYSQNPKHKDYGLDLFFFWGEQV